MTKGRILTVFALILLILGGLWGYGFVGAKAGWIKASDLNGMNPITRNGVDNAGGIGKLMKNSVEGVFD